MVRSKNKKLAHSNKRTLITLLDSKSPIAEQYRIIRTNIQFSSVDQEIKSLMLTSADPGDGKSTTAANLAVAFAQQGKNVLLVDADLRKPTMQYTFNQTNTFGLTSVLTKQINLEQAVAEIDENLYLLTSGPIPPNPAELLGSKAMDHFYAEVLESFDLVIFDTPPVLTVADAQILANKCDGTVLIVSSRKTEKNRIVKAKELLDAAQSKLLGVVLNNKKVKQSDYYYY
ncbi:CpsD/CapB family tyrosine-protein kinase [Neobacillus sp. SAB-20_R2A]|uniref:CpsD/CapB family tyrosine-protein kinase n=1 Tax=Neobacillus sp. SAB-20_R2A TaxID=3120519 RepID=UPI003C6EA244